MSKIMVTITVSSDDMDIILNALEEKALKVNALREDLYQDALMQIQKTRQEQSEIENIETNEKQNVKKGRKNK